MSEVKAIGQIAYEAYCGYSDGRSLVSGEPLPAWSEQREEIRAAWEGTALTLKNLFEKRM